MHTCNPQDEGDTTQVSTLIHSCTVREAKYLLEHFVDTVVKMVSYCMARCTLGYGYGIMSLPYILVVMNNINIFNIQSVSVVGIQAI